MKSVLFFILFSSFLFSCSKDDLPDFNEITSPRIIALIADKPEANPGDNITITPVISDLAATAGVQDSVKVCVDMGIAVGANPSCENNPTQLVVHSHRGLTLPGVGENWTGEADTFSFSIPNDLVIFNQRSSQDKYNGVNYLIEYTLHSPSGLTLKSIKRIVVTESTKTAKNLNPIFTDIFANGVTMTDLPVGTKVNLTSNLSNASAEAYSLKDNSGNLKAYTEQLAITWFITDGSTKYYRSTVAQTNEYEGPTSMPPRPGYILAVARDNRGGVALIKRKLQ